MTIALSRNILTNRTEIARPGEPVSGILTIACPDKIGVIARVTSFLFRYNANIIDTNQHNNAERGTFYMRVKFDLSGIELSRTDFAAAFSSIARDYDMQWQIFYSDKPASVAVLVSRQDHCLYDLLLRQKSGELNAGIVLIISNSDALRPVARSFDIPFYYLPVSSANRESQEAQVIELLTRYRVDLTILARYMQVLSPAFFQHYTGPIINIHHSFLPAFVGNQPYHQAYRRGVKMIGSTSHYVTEELDQGPIIAQDVYQVSHRDSIKDLIRKGRDLERVVLARAVRAHLEHRVVTCANRTIVFE